jgi:sulfoxide reductase catalytic subunit YedY
MIIKIKTSADVPSSEITPESVYRSRREFMKAGVAAAGLAGAAAVFGNLDTPLFAQGNNYAAPRNPKFTVDEKIDKLNTYEQISHHNNFYEFGLRKTDPAQYAGKLTTTPWTVDVEGLCNKPGKYDVEKLVDFKQLEERVYRHRCVEGWSMVMPWDGVPIKSVLDKCQPQAGAKYVEFHTLLRPAEMPGQRSGTMSRYPYVEGLRMDEAMHPLAFMVVGLYGKVLPNQNGAPMRIHIPWKYGFKSGKSIVRIRFTAEMPKTAWAVENPNEYGFWANVNPDVEHPRWSQAREVRLPGLLKNRPTLLFNGYADQVASLYNGMDHKSRLLFY